MSAIWAKMSDRQVEYIQNRLKYESYYMTQGYSWMKNYGYIEPMPKGLKQVLDYKIKETEAANMGFDVEEFKSLSIQIEGNEYKVLLLGRVLEFGLRELQAWVNNSSNIGKETSLEAASIAEFQQKLYWQMDGFVFWGTNMRHAVATDEYIGTNEITGLFNGFTAFGGGAGGDGNVNAAYDYYLTINNAITNLRNAGYEADSYTIFSSVAVRDDCDGGTANHRIATNNFKTELQACLAKPRVDRWIDSPNCLNYGANLNRMVFVPNIMNKANVIGSKEQKDRGKPFTLYEEPISVIPLYGGQLADGLKRKVAIYTAMAWGQTNDTSVYRTGNLVFTAP